MDSLSIICIVIGCVAILRRGPLIFAPRVTLRFYDKCLLSTTSRFRVVGVVFATLAMALLLSGSKEGVVAVLLHTLGWCVATVAFLFVVLPNVFRGFIQTMLGYIERSVDERVIRVVGFFGVVFGLAMIYVGLYVV